MPNVAELIKDHVTLTVDCVDRLYLNLYVPALQAGGGVVSFLRQRGNPIPSPAAFGPITDAFKKGLRQWCEARDVPWIEFGKERKDDVVQPYRERFTRAEGVVLVGVAQEKANAWTATKKVDGRLVSFHFQRCSVFVNHYSIYLIDREWGSGFLTACGYAPYGGKLCLNGHEWVKHQLSRPGIAFTALNNGFLTCDDAAAVQGVCNTRGQEDPVLIAGYGCCLCHSLLLTVKQASPTGSRCSRSRSAGPRSSTTPCGEGNSLRR